jgi:hypothetical protein
MPMPQSWLRPALLLVTVLLHVAALLLFLGQPGARSDTGGAPAMELVWIRTPPPKPPEPAAPVAAAPRPAKPVTTPRRPRAAIAARAPAAASESTLLAVPAAPADQAPASGTAAPFDHGAAIETARKIAREVDPVVPGTKYNETRDEKLGRAIAGAKRQSCLGGNASGNLLTPLMWLMEKKGSGCKF